MGWDGSQFDPLRPHLPDVELVTPTLRALSLKGMVDEAAAAIEPGDVVGGLSMGAAVSLAYAAQPDAACAALVQIAPGFDGDTGAPDPALPRYIAWLADTLEAGGYDSLRAAGEPMVDFWEGRMDPRHLVALWRGLSVGMPIPNPAVVRVPALVLAWPDDGMHPMSIAERLASRLGGGAELRVVPTPTSIELPAEDVAREIRRFLAAHPDGGVGREHAVRD